MRRAPHPWAPPPSRPGHPSTHGRPRSAPCLGGHNKGGSSVCHKHLRFRRGAGTLLSSTSSSSNTRCRPPPHTHGQQPVGKQGARLCSRGDAAGAHLMSAGVSPSAAAQAPGLHRQPVRRRMPCRLARRSTSLQPPTGMWQVIGTGVQGVLSRAAAEGTSAVEGRAGNRSGRQGGQALP